MKKRAFTLVEMLVVIAIVGIIAAVAWNSYRTSIAKSKWAEVSPCLSEAVNRLETFRGNNGTYPQSDPWNAINLSNICSEHYEGAISVTNNGQNFIVAYYDSRKKIWPSGGYDTWYQTDVSGRHVHQNNPIDELTLAVPTGYTLPSP